MLCFCSDKDTSKSTCVCAQTLFCLNSWAVAAQRLSFAHKLVLKYGFEVIHSYLPDNHHKVQSQAIDIFFLQFQSLNSVPNKGPDINPWLPTELKENLFFFFLNPNNPSISNSKVPIVLDRKKERMLTDRSIRDTCAVEEYQRSRHFCRQVRVRRVPFLCYVLCEAHARVRQSCPVIKNVLMFSLELIY